MLFAKNETRMEWAFYLQQLHMVQEKARPQIITESNFRRLKNVKNATNDT